MHLTQKAHALAQAVQQREMRFRAHNRQRNARQTRTGAHIDKALPFQIRVHHNAVENMAHQHFLRIAHGGEIIGFIPLMQQLNVANQLLLLLIGQRNVGCAEQLREFINHGIFQ